MTQNYDKSMFYRGLAIRQQPETGLFCLTDLWQAQNSSPKSRPLAWVRSEATQTWLKELVKQTVAEPEWAERKQQGQPSEPVIIRIPGMLETVKESGDLLTYGTTELAVVYAKFLGGECYEWVLANLVEGREEEANYLEHLADRAKDKQQRVFSRRALIAAGWTVPVVLSVVLQQRPAAATEEPASAPAIIQQAPTLYEGNIHAEEDPALYGGGLDSQNPLQGEIDPISGESIPYVPGDGEF